MHVTTIDRFVPAPGRVVEFAASAATLAVAEGAPASPVPPSFNQRFHLAGAPGHWLACAFDIRGPVDTEALRTAFETFAGRHETLRSGFRSAGSAGPERFVLPAEKLELVTVRDGETYATAEELRTWLRNRLAANCRPMSWPSSLFAAILRPDGGTVVCGFDHCDADGYSLAVAVHELHELYTGRPASSLPPTGSFVDYCALEQEQSSSSPPDFTDPLVQSWSSFFADCDGTTPSFPLPLGMPPGERAPQGTDVRRLLDSDATDEFERRCRAAGGSVFTGLLTALGLAAHRLGADKVIRLLVPLHTRHEERWQHAMGWFTTVAPLTLDVSEATDPAEGSSRTRAAFRKARALAELPVAQVLPALGDSFRRTRTDVFMASYIDYRRFSGSATHLARRAHHISSVTVADDAQFWFSRTHEGLFLRSRYPATAAAEPIVLSFADAVGVLLGRRSTPSRGRRSEPTAGR